MSTNLKFTAVLILTLVSFSHCALMEAEPETDPLMQDPIARVAMQNRIAPPSTEGDAQSVQVRRAIQRGEIILGMNMPDVLSVWGQPRTVEAAGEPGQGNQKWIYESNLWNHLQLKSSRVVFFEAGRVVGWENASH